MSKLGLGIALVMSILGAQIAQANVITACRNTVLGAKRNQCISDLLGVASKQLREVYETLDGALAKPARRKLLASQRDWTLYRDSECEYVAHFYQRQPDWSLYLAQCHYKLTRLRIEQIEQHLASHNDRELKQGGRSKRFSDTEKILRQQVKIPILMPEASLIHADYPEVALAGEDSYQVNFDLSADCHGAPHCSFGSIFASRLKAKNTLILDAHTAPIRLLGGIRGHITHSTHNFDAHFSTLTWEMNDVRYQLTLKRPAQVEFIAIANSAILRGPLE